MLFGDPAKLFGILMGVTLAALVITQQGAIFCGIMTRSFSVISDMPQAEIWVMDPKVQFVDDTKPLNNTELYRVRSTEGVASAAPLYKSLLRARLNNGSFQNCIVIGVDEQPYCRASLGRTCEGQARSVVGDVVRVNSAVIQRVQVGSSRSRRSDRIHRDHQRCGRS